MASSSPSLLRGSAALILWGSQSDLSLPDERALNNWWTNEHLPERLAIPGFHRTRRYYYTSKADSKSVSTTEGDGAGTESTTTHTSHYLVLYEVASLATLTSEAYMTALNNPTTGTQKYMPVLAGMNRSACNVLLSVSREDFAKCRSGGVGGTFAHIVFEAPSSPATRSDLRKWLAGDGWRMMVEFFPNILAMHLLEHEEAASQSGNATRSYDNVSFKSSSTGGQEMNQTQKWYLLAEFTDHLDAPYASYKEKCEALGTGLQQRGVNMSSLYEEIYGLMVMMEE